MALNFGFFPPNLDYGNKEIYPRTRGQGQEKDDRMDTSAEGTFLVKCHSYLRHKITFIFP